MPPYSKLKEFLVEQYRGIVSDPKASVDQRLRALSHLDGLQIKRKPRPKKATSGSFQKGHDPKTRAPRAIDSRLLGAVPETGSSLLDAALLGAVEGVEPLAVISAPPKSGF